MEGIAANTKFTLESHVENYTNISSPTHHQSQVAAQVELGNVKQAGKMNVCHFNLFGLFWSTDYAHSILKIAAFIALAWSTEPQETKQLWSEGVKQ
jgi:hypothetical protein